MASQEEIEQAVYRYVPAGTQEIADQIGLSRQCTAYLRPGTAYYG